jgi:hypothetical protein
VATPRAGGVTLAWDAPVTGAIPLGYRVELGTAPGAADVAVASLPVTTSVSGSLTPGRYVLRLAATNGCGASTATADVGFVVP